MSFRGATLSKILPSPWKLVRLCLRLAARHPASTNVVLPHSARLRQPVVTGTQRAGAPKLCGRITERLGGNSSPAQSNHACINTHRRWISIGCAPHTWHTWRRYPLGQQLYPHLTSAIYGGWFLRQNPAALLRIRDPASIAQKAGWTSLLAWMYSGNLTPNGVQTTDRQASSESLYRPRYPGPRQTFQIRCRRLSK